MKIRSEVMQFAEAMEEQLRANDHKGGWDCEDPKWLFKRLLEEVAELYEQIMEGSVDQQKSEAADVANFAMMIWDLLNKPTATEPGR